MQLSSGAARGLGAGCLAIFVAHLVSISVVPGPVVAVASRTVARRESNEAFVAADVTSRRLRRQADGRLHARPGYKLIRVKAPHGRRRTTTTTTTPPPEDYYYYEVPEDEVPEITTTTRRPVRQRQRIRQQPQRHAPPPPPPPPPRSRQRVRRPPQDYYEYNDVPSVEEDNDHYGYATQKPRSQRPVQYDDEYDRPRKKPTAPTTTSTTTTTTTTTTEPPKPTTTLSPGYKTRPDGRIIDYLADPNFPRELNGADLTDYPFYISVPDDITFDCDKHGDGFFASIEHHCQLFHYCFGGYRYSFLCPNYTVYDQTTFTCRFINTVQCDKSKHYYKRNDALFKESTTTTTTTTTTVAPPTVVADTIAKETAKTLKRAKPAKSKATTTTSTTTTTTESPEDDEEYYEDEYEDETTASPSSASAKPSSPSTTTTTTTTTTSTTTTTTTSKPPPLLAGRKARLNRLKLQKSKSK